MNMVDFDSAEHFLTMGEHLCYQVSIRKEVHDHLIRVYGSPVMQLDTVHVRSSVCMT